MKKFVYSLFMLTVMSMLFASCGTQLSTLSIKKRHYNNGYYVSMNNKHKSEAVSQENTIPVSEVKPATQVTASNNISQSSPVQERTSEGAFISPKNKHDISTQLTASTAKHTTPANLKPLITPNTVKELKDIQAENKRIISENKSNRNSNGNLIWTIIVILLLLWLIALLTGGWGLGGIIYLLLVIALILLVFKLLGLI